MKSATKDKRDSEGAHPRSKIKCDREGAKSAKADAKKRRKNITLAFIRIPFASSFALFAPSRSHSSLKDDRIIDPHNVSF
jgi:hypothetical protein